MAYLGGALDRKITQERITPLHVVQRLRPVRPEELGISASSPDPTETHVEVDGLWVPRQNLRDATLVSLGGRSHPRGLTYDLDAVTRARLCHLQRRGQVMSGWSAAAEWGLEYFVDDADTSVLGGGVSRVATSPSEISRRRRTRALAQIPTYCVDPEFRDLRVTAPVLTIIHCLQSVWAGTHSWPLPAGATPARAGLTGTGVRAVQLIDAMCCLYGVDPAELPAACAHHLDRDRMETVVAWCDQGAESPMETVLRLMVRQVARPVTDASFHSQLVVRADGSVSDPVHGEAGAGWAGTGRAGTGGMTSGAGRDSRRIVARLDLGCPALKLALQYDGSGHLARSVRDKDSEVNADLTNLGWHVLRFTKGHLDRPDKLAAAVTDGIRLCERRLRDPEE